MTFGSGAGDQPLVRNTLRRMDEGWATFGDRVKSIPAEQLPLQIAEGAWTRKQMLAHITAWHDLTSDRLAKFAEKGEPVGLPGDEHEDAINTRTARGADGRTTGEILYGLDDSFRRLRRAVARLSDGQLAAADGWAAAVIAGNSFDHYAEHLSDLGDSGGRG